LHAAKIEQGILKRAIVCFSNSMIDSEKLSLKACISTDNSFYIT